MFNMLLLNSFRIGYEDRNINGFGINIVALSMWYYGVVLPLLWYTAFKGFECFMFKLPYWAWIVLTIHLMLEQLNVVAMFRMRSLSAGRGGVPWYNNLGKGDEDVFVVIMHIVITGCGFFILSTELMEIQPFMFWLLLFISVTLFLHFLSYISGEKDKYYRQRQYLIDDDYDSKFYCSKEL